MSKNSAASKQCIDASNHLIKSWPLGEISYLFELSKAFSPLVVSDTIRGDNCYKIYVVPRWTKTLTRNAECQKYERYIS